VRKRQSLNMVQRLILPNNQEVFFGPPAVSGGLEDADFATVLMTGRVDSVKACYAVHLSKLSTEQNQIRLGTTIVCINVVLGLFVTCNSHAV
jgi:hypothetical protein